MSIREVLTICKNDIDYFNVTFVNSKGEKSDTLNFPFLQYVERYTGKWKNHKVISFEIKTNEELDFTEIYFEIETNGNLDLAEICSEILK